MRLLDQETGTPLEGIGPDVVGRLALQGQMQMVGYWGLPEQTADALQDGWLVTNDLVWRDEDGFVYMLGRADDIINVGGEKASPIEIENTASLCPGIRECACIGVEDVGGVLGEVPALYLVAESADFDPADVTKFLTPKLESYKLPKKFVFVNALPRNAMGKLDRKELRKMWSDSGDMNLTNPTFETILNRHSIRHFTDQPIPRRLLEAVVSAGYHAPSSKNLQTWRFTVLTNQAEIQALKELIAATAQRVGSFFFGYNNPQAVILVSNDQRNPSSIQDSACAVENILLAATSFGLGATWINALRTICDEPEIRTKLDEYGIPQTHTVWSTIVLGWPAKEPKPIVKNPNAGSFYMDWTGSAVSPTAAVRRFKRFPQENLGAGTIHSSQSRSTNGVPKITDFWGSWPTREPKPIVKTPTWISFCGLTGICTASPNAASAAAQSVFRRKARRRDDSFVSEQVKANSPQNHRFLGKLASQRAETHREKPNVVHFVD